MNSLNTVMYTRDSAHQSHAPDPAREHCRSGRKEVVDFVFGKRNSYSFLHYTIQLFGFMLGLQGVRFIDVVDYDVLQ